MRSRVLTVRWAGVALLVVVAWTLASVAGPLDPPAGPVGSTGKTLTEVEPRIVINATNTPGDANSLFKITQPGSYYLAGNIVGVAGKSGIEIAANNATVDLRGFSLIGVPGSLDGIVHGDNGCSGITIRSGSITDWDLSGVELSEGGATLLEGLSAGSNGRYGIRSGTAGIVRFCTSNSNGSYGIIGYSMSIVESCVAIDNGHHGIAVGTGGQIRGCCSRSNQGDGIEGVSNAVIADCMSFDNEDSGIRVGAGTVQRCTSSTNGRDGILAESSSLIIGNQCNFNGVQAAGGAGIHATGGDNRIEGNNCTRADRGIQVDLAGNVIVRNTCSGNTTDWQIAANNVYGPIIDRRAPASAAVTGFSAPDSTDSTHPNANFSY